MEKWKKKAIELVSKQLIGEGDSASVVPYIPQKLRLLEEGTKYFRRVRPERHGISSSRLYAMLCELEAEPRANVQSLAVIANGDIIAECSQPGYSVNMPHLSHSMSKTVTGMAIGMLVDDGKLSTDARITDLFPEYKLKDKVFDDMTVEHLLKMSSGSDFAEFGSVTSDDWMQSFFNSEIKYKPGNGFSYNSMNTYILSRIVCKIAKKSLTEFLDERLFTPLHIKNYLWEKSVDGVEKGGWGLYLSCEDWAKLGLMMLQGGMFEGRRILSQRWVNLTTSVQNISDGRLGDFDYGYQIWVGKDGTDFLFNGMFGQNVWVCPKNNILVSLCCGNNELFQRSPTLGIVRKYLGANMQDIGVKTSYFALKYKQKHFFESRRLIMPKPKPKWLYRFRILKEHSISSEWKPIEGEYKFPKNNIGILPLFVRLMQNNLNSHLETLKIKCTDSTVIFTFGESGEEYVITAGIRDYISGTYDFRGEKYRISAMCEEKTDTSGNPVYKLALIFPELPNTSTIELTPENGGLRLKFAENPGRRIVDAYIEASKMSPIAMMLMALLKRAVGDSFVTDAIDLLFAPELVAINAKDEHLDEKMEEQNIISSELKRKYSRLMPIINRFIGDNE